MQMPTLACFTSCAGQLASDLPGGHALERRSPRRLQKRPLHNGIACRRARGAHHHSRHAPLPATGGVRALRHTSWCAHHLPSTTRFAGDEEGGRVDCRGAESHLLGAAAIDAAVAIGRASALTCAWRVNAVDWGHTHAHKHATRARGVGRLGVCCRAHSSLRRVDTTVVAHLYFMTHDMSTVVWVPERIYIRYT